jgi:hypothetical protein
VVVQDNGATAMPPHEIDADYSRIVQNFVIDDATADLANIGCIDV